MRDIFHKNAFIIAFLFVLTIVVVPFTLSNFPNVKDQSVTPDIDTYEASPPIHIKGQFQPNPVGLTPQQIYSIYHLPGKGGSGTIAIIDAFDYPPALSDLNVFNSTFGLPTMSNCTSPTQKACFEEHMMSTGLPVKKIWAAEASLEFTVVTCNCSPMRAFYL